MARKILVNGGIFETRLALCDDDRLVEICHLPLGAAHGFDDLAMPSRIAGKALAGQVYLGRVVHVAKPMGAAFVDLGEGENGFLPLSTRPRKQTGSSSPFPHEGEALMVQVIKEAVGEKGPRLSTRIQPELAARLAENQSKPPCLLHAGRGALCAAIEKMAGQERVERIIVDHPAAFALVRQRGPGWAVKCLQRAMPGDLFATAGLEEQIEAARSPVCDLPGGGSLIFEATSAFMAIDVNAGSMQAGNLREKVNLEAARAIPHELRLRGIGGQIVIDFLALKDNSAWARVTAALKHGLNADPALTRLEKISRGGLLAITRERRFAPLNLPVLPAVTPRSAAETANEILRELQRNARHRAGRQMRVRAAPAVITWLERQPELRDVLMRELGIAPLWLPLDGAENSYFEIFEDT